MTRSSLPCLMSAAGLLVLAACGGSGDSSAASTDSSAAAAAPAAVTAEAGAARYGQVCASCHMANGEGQAGVLPPLAGSEWVTGDPRIPIAIVLAGLQGPIQVKGTSYDAVMQPWGMMPDSDVAAVVTYIRSTWGNSAPPVTEADVAAIRSAIGARGAWTADELKAAYPGQ